MMWLRRLMAWYHRPNGRARGTPGFGIPTADLRIRRDPETGADILEQRWNAPGLFEGNDWWPVKRYEGPRFGG